MSILLQRLRPGGIKLGPETREVADVLREYHVDPEFILLACPQLFKMSGEWEEEEGGDEGADDPTTAFCGCVWERGWSKNCLGVAGEGACTYA